MTVDIADYDYSSLEEVLEQAAYRLPVKVLCSLLERAEYLIITRASSIDLEREIYSMLGVQKKPFALQRIAEANNQDARVAA
jgi:hypothetical protein